MDYSKKTAQKCMEDYELHGATVTINDGKVSAGEPEGELEGDSDGGM